MVGSHYLISIESVRMQLQLFAISISTLSVKIITRKLEDRGKQTLYELGKFFIKYYANMPVQIRNIT